MRIYETELTDRVLETLIAMSVKWEAELSTFGYRANERNDIEGNRIFLAEGENGECSGSLRSDKPAERCQPYPGLHRPADLGLYPESV